MPDVDEGYRALARVKGRDLWSEIEGREPQTDVMTAPPRGRRLTAAVMALLVAGAGLGLAVRAFQQEPRSSSSAEGVARLAATLDVVPRGQTTAVLAAAGQVWVTAYGIENQRDEAVQRIDPDTNSVVATIPLEAVPTWEQGGGGVAYGHESLWVVGARSVDSELEAILQRIDPATSEIQATIPLPFDRFGDVVANDEAVWVASFPDQAGAGQAELARVDPVTNAVVAKIPLAHDFIRRLVALEDAVVVEEWGDRGTVIEVIDVRSNTIAATSGPEAWDADGGRIVQVVDQVWATIGDGFDRVDLTTGEPAGQPVGQGIVPRCVCTSSGSSIWILGRGQLELLDVQTGEQTVVLQSANLSESIDIAATEESVWLLTFDGVLTRVAVE